MKELTCVMATLGGSRRERSAVQKAFLKKRREIWEDIREGRFPATYTSDSGRKFTGAPGRTAIRCDFLLASKMALGSRFRRDRIADAAQRDLLFYVLRDREAFPHRTGKKFYCCPACTSKLHQCVSARIFRYIDNARWKAEIESGR